MRENIHMQNATWLVSRELAEAAGPWDTRLHFDQDGEYFCRVLLASEGTRFVPGTGIYYRASGANSVSFIGNSDKKKDSLLLSMKLHIQYLRSLEDSERVRKACLAYIQTWCRNFYPERPDLMQEAQQLAAMLGGRLELPKLSWKYRLDSKALWLCRGETDPPALEPIQIVRDEILGQGPVSPGRRKHGRDTWRAFVGTPRFELPKNYRCNGVEPSDLVVATIAEFLLTVTSARVVP